MTTAEIIQQICSETGLDLTGKEALDLVPLNDLNIHKTAVWNLTITDAPNDYFLRMTRQYPNKIGYRFKFPVADASQGLALCQELSRELGLQETAIPPSTDASSTAGLYLAIHIHPEFVFTPSKAKTKATQTLKLCFV